MKVLFVGGCPRSGTTLVGHQLSRGADVVVTPETQFIIGAYTRLPDRVTLHDARAFITRHHRFRLWGVELPAMASDDGKLIPKEEAIALVLSEIIAELHHDASGSGPALWVDHTPNNVRVFYFLERLFPGAHFVHVVRDPRAVAHSIVPLDWGPATPSRAADLWTSHVLAGLSLEMDLGASRVRTVRFEDLVSRPDSTVADLLEWVGVEPKHSAGTFRPPPYYAENYHGLVGNEPDQTRAEAWKSDLDALAIEHIELACGTAMVHFGYSLESRKPPRAPSGVRRARDALSAFVHEVGYNTLRQRLRMRSYANRSEE